MIVIKKIYWGAVWIFAFSLLIGSALTAQSKGGRWQFENNGEDTAPWKNNHNSGIISGSAFYGSDEPLTEGNYYLSLEDPDNYGAFTVNDNSSLDFQNESIAVSLWAYPVEGNGNPQFLLIKGNRSGDKKTDNYSIRLNKSNSKYFVEFLAHIETGALRSVTSSFDLPVNRWSYIAVYYDYPNNKLYLWNEQSSAPIDTFNFSADLFPNDDKLYIGAAGENGFKRFRGRIDDVRIGSSIDQIRFDITNIENDKEKVLSHGYRLFQNYPNPFNPATTIEYSTPEAGFITIKLYSILGKELATLVEGIKEPGNHKVIFDAGKLKSGIYFYRLQAGSYNETKKLILIK